MKKKGFIVIEGFILFILGAFILLIVVVLGADFTKTMQNSVGWVYQANHGTAVKEFQKEEDGCVYYIDVWDNSGKTCGVYEIQKY